MASAQVPQEYSWLHAMKQELGKLPELSSNWTICRVPSKLRTVCRTAYTAHVIPIEPFHGETKDGYMVFPLMNADAYSPQLISMNADAYSPQLISIGPLHHGEANVQAMEEHKKHYLFSLLRRTSDPDRILDDCAFTIQRLDRSIQDCYGEQIKFDASKLAKMVLVDGCFIIELFLRSHMADLKWSNDPVFTTSWMMSSLQHDLALLENQIPFFVLETLFDLIARHSAFPVPLVSLPELALRFFRSALHVSEESFGTSKRESGYSHLLDLIHNCYLPTSPRIVPKGKMTWEFIHCATELTEAGIEFKKDSQTENLFDLKFKNGVFTIPALRIHDLTESLFRNLIAFEQCFPGNAQYVTSYAVVIDRLIDSGRDVQLLECQGIIENDLGGREDVSVLFNNIGKQVELHDFYYEGLCEQVNEYYNKRLNRYKALLKREYFPNPCRVIAFIAAFVLLVLTALQTVYSVLGYYPHS